MKAAGQKFKDVKKIIRLFLSSPGDVEKEREKVRSVVAQVNRIIDRFINVVFEVIDWKTHVAPDMGRPQEVINRQIGDYDIFVGIMWKRFGTPTGSAESGTEEEFNIAYANWERFQRPRIMFYFNQTPYMPKDSSEIAQFGKVIAFKEKIQQRGLCFEYQREEFADLLREHLIMVLKGWFKPVREGALPIADFTRYLNYLRDDTMYIDVRGLVVGEGKAPQIRIDELYIPLKSTAIGLTEGRRPRGEKELPGEAISREALLQEALKEPQVPAQATRETLPLLAREVGLLGGMVRDLSPFDFKPANPAYPEIVKGVMGIFDRAMFREIPVQVRIEAADTLGSVGDPRLEDECNLWVHIPGGSFWMGAQKVSRGERNYDESARDNESPVHCVELSPFSIGRYPVTVGQYLRFIEDGGYEKPEFWKSSGFGEFKHPRRWDEQLEYRSRPIVYVSWYEAAAYASWCGCRLPTEAEWERAARGPGNEYRKYPWGSKEPDAETANFDKSNIGHVTPVGIFPECCSPEGVIDMAGNVWEWCGDWYREAYYEYCSKIGTVKNPKGPEKGNGRVVRGGSFLVNLVLLRCADRGRFIPLVKDYFLGFRVVRGVQS